MKRIGSEVVGSLFWMVVGIFFALGGIQLKQGTLGNPGPGFLPLVMAFLLIALSLFILAKGLFRQESFLRRIPWERPALVIASIFFFGLLLDLVGFLLATFILMFLLFGLLMRAKSKWPMIFLYAAVTALVAWLVFAVSLGVPFPPARLATIWS